MWLRVGLYIDYGDARPIYVLQFTEPRMFENSGHGLESSRTAGGEQQPKLSGHNRGAAVEADAIEEQLKRTI